MATPFEFRTYAIELQLCQRYYVRLGKNGAEIIGTGHMRATNACDASCVIPVQLRSTPVIQLIGSATIYPGTASIAVSSINFTTYNSTVLWIRYNSSSSATAGSGAIVVTNDASSYLDITCEL